MASTRFNLRPHFIDEETKVWGGCRCRAAQPGGLLPCAAAALEHRGEWGWHHPPQGGVEDNREGQEDHGGSTAGLRNAREGLRGVLVQDRPLWANRIPPPPKPGPHQLEARQPALRTEVWAFSELLGSG